MLDPVLATGEKSPRWQPRSHKGIFVGFSPVHSSDVPLVLNLRTGHISPQYHVVYDDEFSTVPYLAGTTVPPNWEILLNTSSEHTVNNEELLYPTWLHRD